MSKKDEALKQALEALSPWAGEDANHTEQYAAYHALRERLAQPEQKTCLVANEPCKHGSWCSEVYCQEHCKFAQPAQEPVAWLSEGGDVSRSKLYMDEMGFKCEPLYKSPPQRKPLTMQERTSIVRANKSFHDKNEIDAYGIIDDVEAAHGIKE